MPSNSTGTIAIWKDATKVAAVVLSPQDTGVRLRQIQAPTVVELPNDSPNDGDSYEVLDADGSCSSSNQIELVPPPGTTIRGASSFFLSLAFVGARLVFDARANDWTLATTAGSGSAPASGWADSVQTITNGPVPTIFASKTVTPTSSGKFRVTATGAVQNASDSGTVNFTIEVTHGAGVTSPPDYAAPSQCNDNGGGRQFQGLSMSVDLDELPVPLVFPVGTPVTLNGIIHPTGGQALQWADHMLQLTITEK